MKFFTYTIFIIYFLFFIFLFFYFWAGPRSAHMGWARPSQPQPSPVSGSSQWPAGQMIDARVKQFHACINSAKVIKLPSHYSNALLNTDNERRIGRTCFWRWRRRLQCRWLLFSLDCFPLSPRCVHCLPFFLLFLISLFLRWRSWVGMSVS